MGCRRPLCYGTRCRMRLRVCSSTEAAQTCTRLAPGNVCKYKRVYFRGVGVFSCSAKQRKKITEKQRDGKGGGKEDRADESMQGARRDKTKLITMRFSCNQRLPCFETPVENRGPSKRRGGEGCGQRHRQAKVHTDGQTRTHAQVHERDKQTNKKQSITGQHRRSRL